ncbi:MAG: hypothetical protein HYX92_01445 [Chloroflexi bacterium]|nr:hypothetical protein [Chloroflexota bacterium]
MGSAEASVSIVLLGGLLVLACGPAAPAGPASSPTPAKSTDCPKLENRLYQLFASPDPAAFAQQYGIGYSDGAVRVVVEMGDKEGRLPAGYSIKEETRSGGLVQAQVPLSELCRLSKEGSVKAIRLPLRAVPLRR